jgi:VCBS repeat-containing protein
MAVPEITVNFLEVFEETTVGLTTDNLNATAEGASSSQIFFTILPVLDGDGSSLLAGNFLLRNPGTGGEAIATTFTLRDVQDGRVRFQHLGSNNAPQYRVTASFNGEVSPESLPEVNFLAINDGPTISRNVLEIREGETITLNSVPGNLNLVAQDEESTPDQLTYTIQQVANGTFQRVVGATVQNLTLGNQFTQAEVDNQLIRFRHDGSETPPTYRLRVVDSGLLGQSAKGNTSTVAVTFTPVNDLPVITKNEITLRENDTIAISSLNLAATDVEDNDSTLTFEITGVTGGRFELLDGGGQVVKTLAAPGQVSVPFLQADVAAGRVRFVNDPATDTPPTYTLSVKDSGNPPPIETVTQPGKVNFTAVNDPPVLKTFDISLEEGDTVPLTADRLLVEDEESGAANVTYTVLSSTAGSFVRVSDGSPVTVFTQADINSGNTLIFQHDGSNNPPVFELKVSDAQGASILLDSGDGVVFAPINDVPVVLRAQITLDEGDRFTLSNAENLAVTDEESRPNQLLYTVTLANTDPDPAKRDRFFVDGVEQLGPTITFTQSQLNAGVVKFDHGGSNFAPDLKISVQDTAIVPGGKVNTLPLNLAINFTATNDAPNFAVNTLSITEGGTVVLNSAAVNLQTTDEETTNPANLEYSIDTVSNGKFQRLDGPAPVDLAVEDTFSQADVDAGLIQFVHDGSETPPSYKLTVRDEAVGNDPQQAVTRIVEIPAGGFISENDPPELGNNSLTLAEGDTVFLGSDNLSATDEEGNIGALVFTVSPITNGRFERVTFDPDTGAETTVENLTPEGAEPLGFTQAEIAAGRIRFVHDPAVDTPPTYTVRVTDAGGLFDEDKAAINFTKVNDIPVLTTLALTILEGETVPLDDTILSVSDEETGAAGIAYTVDEVAAGNFVSTVDGAVRITFTQADIAAGAIAFQHNDSNTAPTFTLTVTDGVNPITVTSTDGDGVIFIPTNDAPVTNKSELVIGEGETVTLTAADNLSTLDEETPPEALTYTVTVTSQDANQPDGFEVKGEFLTGDNIQFTQAEVNAGLVKFVQGGSNFAPEITMTVSDTFDPILGNPITENVDFQVTFNVFNDVPVVKKNEIALSEGEVVTLSPDLLLTTDEVGESGPDGLTYKIETFTNGSFQVFGPDLGVVVKTLVVGDTFTQAAVNAGTIQFAHDGNELAPSYSLTVSDEPQEVGGLPNEVPTTVKVTNFQNINDDPTFQVNQLTIQEGARVTLSAANLKATDLDNKASALVFEISAVKGGQFFLKNQPLAPGQTFKATSLSFGEVVFQDDGNEEPPSYTVTVRDPQGGSTTAPATINYESVNDLPRIVTNKFDITEGERLELSTDNLSGEDDETLLAEDLVFTVDNVEGGSFLDFEGNPVDSFTQADLQDGSISFIPDPVEALDVVPAFDITLSDGDGGSVTEAAEINFISVNDAPSLDVNTLTVTEGGAVFLSLDNLKAIDPDDLDDALTFTVSPITNGRFERVTFDPDTGAETTVENLTPEGAEPLGFTQAEIAAGRIRFVHDPAVDTPPTYTVRVTDAGGLFDEDKAAINFTKVNDIPVLTTLALTILEGETVPLDDTILSVSDEETGAAGIAYTVDEVAAGNFVSTVDGAVRITFTQADIAAGAIAFQHNDSNTAPTFTLTVTDGVNPITVTSTDGDGVIFIPTNDAPVTNKSELVIGEGETVTLTAADNLSTLDEETPPEALTYTVTVTSQDANQPDGFEVKGEFLTGDNIQFTQAEVNAGLVKFVQGGSNFAPEITMTVSDTFDPILGNPITENVDFQVTFNVFNDVPVVKKNEIALSEGEVVTLSPDLLLTTDEVGESGPDGLTYKIETFTNGSFQVFGPDLGVVVKTLVVGDTFTQAAVNAGTIQFAHDGNELAPSYSLTVSDEPQEVGGLPNEVPTTVKVTNFQNINDDPTFQVNQLTIQEGARVTLSAANLKATDLDNKASALVFEISAVKGGQFFLKNQPLAPGQTFKAASLSFGEVVFQDDGNEEPPSYTVTVRDPQGGSTTEPATINYEGVNDDPEIVTNTFEITEGERLELSEANLLAKDAETSNDADLRFSVSNVEGGSFLDFEGNPVESFTQEQLKSGEISFVPIPVVGPDVPAAFDITIKDPDGGSTTVSAIIDFQSVNDPPELGNNQLSVTEGETVLVTKANLSGIDTDSPDEELTFTVSDLDGGKFLVDGVEATSFTQADILEGLVEFEDDGDEAPPSFSVSVSDGDLGTDPSPATITEFINVNDAPDAVDDEGTGFATDAENSFVTASVLLNDTDSDPGDIFDVIQVNGQDITDGTFKLESGAVLTFAGNGTFTYDPNGQFVALTKDEEGTDTFEYATADIAGETDTATVTITITGVDDAPTLISNSLSLFRGQSVELTTANILASDPDTEDSDLLITVSDVQGGVFLLNGDAVTTFTQQDIADGNVRFAHDGGEVPPTYALSVSDDTSSTPTSEVLIKQFIPVNIQAINGGIFDYEQTLRFFAPSVSVPNDSVGDLPLAQLFDEQYYLTMNPDVAAAVQNGTLLSGYQHFAQTGILEGRNPSVLYNESFYLNANADVRNAVNTGVLESGLQHFLITGAQEPRSGSQFFNQEEYLSDNPDVDAAVQDGLLSSGFQHYIVTGSNELRDPQLFLYNEQYYLTQNPDVKAFVDSGLIIDGFQHFATNGQFEGRAPSILFNESSYLALNPDVEAEVDTGLVSSGFSHYVQAGRFEGRSVFA